ncbi:MAG: molybdenum cofactor biosynthesis protein MoaE [Bacteroidota bacterium]
MSLSAPVTDIQVLDIPLSLLTCYDQVKDPAAGGIDMFVGTVRDQTDGRTVQRLEFEAYVPMALKEMHVIADQVSEMWPVHRMVIHHRIGTLEIGEIPVIIAVSAAHRDAAFRACRFIIDTLKQTVPIWKKEIFADGEVWVAAHP